MKYYSSLLSLYCPKFRFRLLFIYIYDTILCQSFKNSPPGDIEKADNSDPVLSSELLDQLAGLPFNWTGCDGWRHRKFSACNN